MLLGLFLRTWNLSHHGFSHYDEAHYMMEVKFWKDILTKSGELLDALRGGRLNAAYLESAIDGLPPSFTPKPLHGFFMALFSLGTGLRADWSGCLWSALIGTLTIGLVGWWAGRHFGAATGILAALFLAVSRSHVMYSRSQLAEADAIFFLAVALFLHVNLALRLAKSQAETGAPVRVWPTIGVGVLYGIAVAVNYRCLIVLPIVWLWDMLVARQSIRRLVFLGLGILVVIAMLELPYRIYIWRGGNLPAGMMTYLEGFWFRMFQDLPMGESKPVSSFVQPHLGMFTSYAWLDRTWWKYGMLLGLWATWRSRCPVRFLICLLAWIPLLMFSLVTRGDGPRAVMTSIPFFAMLCAVGWMEFYSSFKADLKDSWVGRGWLAFARVTLAILLIGGGAGAWRETTVRSAWPAVGAWLAEQPKQTVQTTFPLAVRYYLRKDQAKLPPREDTAPLTPGLWVIDRYNAAYAYPYPVVNRVRASYTPERVFEGQVYPQTGLFLDWGVFVRTDWEAELERKQMGAIEIYRVPEAPRP